MEGAYKEITLPIENFNVTIRFTEEAWKELLEKLNGTEIVEGEADRPLDKS